MCAELSVNRSNEGTNQSSQGQVHPRVDRGSNILLLLVLFPFPSNLPSLSALSSVHKSLYQCFPTINCVSSLLVSPEMRKVHRSPNLLAPLVKNCVLQHIFLRGPLPNMWRVQRKASVLERCYNPELVQEDNYAVLWTSMEFVR